MLGFWEPSNCRRPGAALENPTDFGDETLFDKVEFGVKLDGFSIDGALTFGNSIVGADESNGMGIPKVATGTCSLRDCEGG